MNSRVNPELERLTTIVFDVDGTLYQQSGLRRAMFFRLLKHVVCHPGEGIAVFGALRAYRHAQEHLRGAAVDGALADAQIRLACERSGQPTEAVTAIVDRWMEREPLDLLERFVMPGLRTFLAAAKDRGLRLGVLSDYPAAAKLEAMKLTEFFDVVVSAQDARVNRFKPDPSGLAEALRQLGATPSEALYVGDRHDVDATVASAAGVACVIVGKRRTSRASEDSVHGSASNGAVSSLSPSAGIANYGDLHTMLFHVESEQTS
jgi:HAD superfamily hydrolase (TIGR01509 family)